MKEQLERYVKRVKELHEHCRNNEQQTKQSLIVPLFVLLGYDMTDPHECKPEYRTDFGKGEKAAHPVDWAFLKDGALAFFVEAKEAGAKITKHSEQLAMYFGKEPGPKGVKLGILTCGTQWLFFTDLVHDNAMDKEPFFKWDVIKDDPALAVDLMTILQKSKFTPQLIKEYAKRKSQQSILVKVLDHLFKPSTEFVKFAITTKVNEAGETMVSGMVNQKVIDQWKPILKDAIDDWVRQQALTMALQHPSKSVGDDKEMTAIIASVKVAAPPTVDEDDEPTGKRQDGMRIPQLRVLQALMPDGKGTKPILNRVELAEKAGFNPTTGTINRALNGIPESSASGDAHKGVIDLGLVAKITRPVDGGGDETVYQITAAGVKTFAKYVKEEGELPPIRDKQSSVNKRYQTNEPDDDQDSIDDPKAKAVYAATLQDIIGANLVSVPCALFKEFKGKMLKATLQPDGKVEFAGVVYDTCSSAAEFARSTVVGERKSTNGWIFWHFTDKDGTNKTLDDIRQRFLETKGLLPKQG